MFMIQTVQDAEQGLEAARAARTAAMDTLGTEVATLQRQVQEMEVAIAAAADKCTRLQVAGCLPLLLAAACAAGCSLAASKRCL